MFNVPLSDILWLCYLHVGNVTYTILTSLRVVDMRTRRKTHLVYMRELSKEKKRTICCRRLKGIKKCCKEHGSKESRQDSKRMHGVCREVKKKRRGIIKQSACPAARQSVRAGFR